MMSLAPFIILCIVSILGSLGNVFIIAAVCLRKKLRVRGNMFVVNLAVADLIVTGYIMPMGLVTSQYEHSSMSIALCEFNAFLILTTLGVSTQSLMMIAMERYIHICQTHYYDKLLRPSVCAALVATCWVYTIIWTCQGWSGWTRYVYAEEMYICIFSARASLSYCICLAVFGIILPMVVVSVCYYKIFKTVKNSRLKLDTEHSSNRDSATKALTKKRRRRLRQEHRLITTLFTIVILFILFWLPATIVLSISAIISLPYLLFTISIWTAFCNSCVNSIVYGVMNNNFRAGYVALVRWLFCCGRSTQACQSGTSNSALSNDDSASTSHNTTGKRRKSSTVASTVASSMVSIDEAGSVVSTEVSYTNSSSMKFGDGMNIPMVETNYQRYGYRT